jgi:Signal recognition particle 9 kDa protein (SRP9)
MLIKTRLTLKYKVPKQTVGTTNSTAILVAKAYDPVGGVCLKYETNRAVEVGRLMLGFQELGQLMQNVPRTIQKGTSGDEDVKVEAMAIDEAGPAVQGKAETQVKQGQSPMPASLQTSGGKKKKKTKR